MMCIDHHDELIKTAIPARKTWIVRQATNSQIPIRKIILNQRMNGEIELLKAARLDTYFTIGQLSNLRGQPMSMRFSISIQVDVNCPKCSDRPHPATFPSLLKLCQSCTKYVHLIKRQLQIAQKLTDLRFEV
ncbi:MAG: hypothetical protein ACRC62_18470 [Microcoleus sp.]